MANGGREDAENSSDVSTPAPMPALSGADASASIPETLDPRSTQHNELTPHPLPTDEHLPKRSTSETFQPTAITLADISSQKWKQDSLPNGAIILTHAFPAQEPDTPPNESVVPDSYIGGQETAGKASPTIPEKTFSRSRVTKREHGSEGRRKHRDSFKESFGIQKRRNSRQHNRPDDTSKSGTHDCNPRSEVLQALPAMCAVGIFLASINTTLLSISRPKQNRADSAISACWLISMMLSVSSCVVTMLLYKSLVTAGLVAKRRSSRSWSGRSNGVEEAGFYRQVICSFSFYLLVLSTVMLFIGCSIWTWNGFSQMVASAATLTGVVLSFVTLGVAWCSTLLDHITGEQMCNFDDD